MPIGIDRIILSSDWPAERRELRRRGPRECIEGNIRRLPAMVLEKRRDTGLATIAVSSVKHPLKKPVLVFSAIK